MMAGLDGIKNKIDPGPGPTRTFTICRPRNWPPSHRLRQPARGAGGTGEKAHDFLLAGVVFTKDLLGPTWA